MRDIISNPSLSPKKIETTEIHDAYVNYEELNFILKEFIYMRSREKN